VRSERREPDMVVHICNPSYLGGRGRRNMVSRLALAKVAVRPCL
jgi:hypothetical protein